MKPRDVRVLIAEDDALLRDLLEASLRPHFPELTLVANGLQAITHLQENPIDVLVTDWMMPEMDGIELIRRVRAESAEPPFVIMNTVLGSSEARAHALKSGADDFLTKPARAAEVRACIELGAQRRDSSRLLAKAKPTFLAPARRPANQGHVIVAIGVSTGGPAALGELFADDGLPSSCVYLVTLHGPEWLHKAVAESLQRTSRLGFALAEHGARVLPGTVYFACKDRHLALDAQLRLSLDESPPEHFLRPAVDPMFRSLARGFGPSLLAVVMTGMGHDGVAGAAEIVAAGGTVLAQDPQTCVVGSMPAAVIDAGLAAQVLPLSGLSRGVTRHAERLLNRPAAREGSLERSP